MWGSLNTLLDLKEIDEVKFNHILPDILEVAGVLLRNSGDIANAKLCYLCALHSSPSMEKISLLANYAIPLVHEGKYTDARAINLRAKALANDSLNKIQLTKIENSLGVIAFELKEFDEATTHFINAYQLHQNSSKRDSILVVGINILFTPIVANKPDLFLRTLPNVSRLSENSDSKAIQSSLLWVNSAFENKNGRPVDNDRKVKLSESFSFLANDRVKGYYIIACQILCKKTQHE